MSEQYIRTKTVIVSPKWALTFEDVKDLAKDVFYTAGAAAVLAASDYIGAIDPSEIAGSENHAISAAGIGLAVALLTRLGRKWAKESNYPHPNE